MSGSHGRDSPSRSVPAHPGSEIPVILLVETRFWDLKGCDCQNADRSACISIGLVLRPRVDETYRVLPSKGEHSHVVTVTRDDPPVFVHASKLDRAGEFGHFWFPATKAGV